MASHHAPPGHSKVSLNLRTAVWRGDATGNQGIADACKAQGIDPVALIEALLLRYLNGTEQERRRMESEASREMRARRQLVAVLRKLERSAAAGLDEAQPHGPESSRPTDAGPPSPPRRRASRRQKA